MTEEPTLVFSTALQPPTALGGTPAKRTSPNTFTVTSGDLISIFSSNPNSPPNNTKTAQNNNNNNNTRSYAPTTNPTTTDPSRTSNPYTYRGPHAEYGHRFHRLHQDFKSLTKEERQKVVQQEAEQTDLLARTVHLRFLPTMMKQGELAAICRECGEYQRVRICGNSTNNQNWIYGFVEFSSPEGAANMMRRSGMELPNGPGRPPLRLKCNNAKSPIVDRIFHDANPEDSRSKCIFGHDNYAHRTLKDALDSYFHLKAKEAQQRDEQNSPGVGSGSDSGEAGQSASGLTSAERSPHAKPFTLSPSAVAFNPLHLSPALQGLPPPGFPSSAAAMNEDGGIPPPPSYEVASATTSLHATPGLHFQPPNLAMLPPPLAEPTGAGGYLMLPASVTSVGEARERQTPSLGPVDAAASQLSHALEQLMHNTSGTDGEEIVARGRALATLGMQQSWTAMQANHNCHHALGTLSSLLTLLDEHAAVTGGEKNTGAGDLYSELPQRVTQLRLLANLLNMLLCMYRRRPNEALPYIQNIVTVATGVPSTPVAAPAAVLLRRMKLKSNSNTSEDYSNNAPSANQRSRAVEAGMFAFLDGESDELRQAIMDCMADEEVEAETDRHREEDAAAETLYARDVAFHAFVLNVLVTVGLAMEGIQPNIARSTYTCAATRAEEVLGLSSSAVSRRLAESGPITEALWQALLGREGAESAATNAQRDITTFPREFFAAMESLDLETHGEDDDAFWRHLPPLHHVCPFTIEA